MNGTLATLPSRAAAVAPLLLGSLLLLANCTAGCGRLRFEHLSDGAGLQDAGLDDFGLDDFGLDDAEMGPVDAAYLRFDGAQYIAVPTTPQLDLGGTFTIAVSVFLPEDGPAGEMPLVTGGVSPDNTYVSLFLSRGTDGVRACLRDRINAGGCAAPAAGRLSRWLSIVLSASNDAAVTYIDGVRVHSSQPTTLVGDDVRFGNDAHTVTGATFLHGRLRRVAIWSQTLSDAEVLEWESGAPPSGLVARWIIAEGAGQVLREDVEGLDATLGASSAVEPQDPMWAR